MKRSAFLFFKGLGLLFAILCGIGTAVLGWFDGADWMNIATYSIAVTGLILWGWYHFSVRWINEDLKQNIFTKFPKEENIKEDERITRKQYQQQTAKLSQTYLVRSYATKEYFTLYAEWYIFRKSRLFLKEVKIDT